MKTTIDNVQVVYPHALDLIRLWARDPVVIDEILKMALGEMVGDVTTILESLQCKDEAPVQIKRLFSVSVDIFTAYVACHIAVGPLDKMALDGDDLTPAMIFMRPAVSKLLTGMECFWEVVTTNAFLEHQHLPTEEELDGAIDYIIETGSQLFGVHDE